MSIYIPKAGDRVLITIEATVNEDSSVSATGDDTRWTQIWLGKRGYGDLFALEIPLDEDFLIEHKIFVSVQQLHEREPNTTSAEMEERHEAEER